MAGLEAIHVHPPVTPESASGGHVLYVSRSAPPGKSGSAHVLKALLAADEAGRLIAVGARPFLSRTPASTGRVQLLPTEMSLFGRGARFFSLPRQMLQPLLARRLAAMAAKPDVASIVCVFPDALYCAAALSAARKTGKPIRFYFHNTYADNRSGIAGWHARRLEARMVGQQADGLMFISEALMRHFQGKYAGIAHKCEVMPHPVPGAVASARGFTGQPVKATMMGNLNPSNLDAATRMLRALSGHPALRIRLCTPVPKLLLAARGVDLSRVEYLGYLPDEEMAALLAETDLFLLPHGLTGGYSDSEYRTIFPTRAAHYLAQARPVLAHCPADSGLARYLIERDCALCVAEADELAVRKAFEKLLDDPNLQQRLAFNAAEAARSFDPAAILSRLAPVQVSS